MTSRTFKQVNHVRAQIRAGLGSTLKKISNSVSVGEYKVKFDLRVGISKNFFERFPNFETKSTHIGQFEVTYVFVNRGDRWCWGELVVEECINGFIH